MGSLNNIHDKTNISPDILQLLPNAFPYLFGSAFLTLGQFQIIPAGSPAPHPGLFQLVGFTVHINARQVNIASPRRTQIEDLQNASGWVRFFL